MMELLGCWWRFCTAADKEFLHSTAERLNNPWRSAGRLFYRPTDSFFTSIGFVSPIRSSHTIVWSADRSNRLCPVRMTLNSFVSVYHSSLFLCTFVLQDSTRLMMPNTRHDKHVGFVCLVQVVTNVILVVEVYSEAEVDSG